MTPMLQSTLAKYDTTLHGNFRTASTACPSSYIIFSFFPCPLLDICTVPFVLCPLSLSFVLLYFEVCSCVLWFVVFVFPGSLVLSLTLALAVFFVLCAFGRSSIVL